MFRPVNILLWDVTVHEERDGVIRVHPSMELGPYPETLTDVLDQWAALAPNRTFSAKRINGGDWRYLTYAQFRKQARNTAQWLIDAKLSGPIVILSGNDLEHAVLGMAAMYAGISYAPISPAYSLVSTAFGKLRHIFGLLEPGLVFVSDGDMYAKALQAGGATNVVATRNGPALFETLTNTADRDFTVKATADSIAKILFTSGSTGVPKGVINTQRMLCSNQEMLRTVSPFFAETPPVVCDWLPWNHTFGGNHNFGLVLYNGGTIYIDDGKPVGPAFDETLRNLREIAPTVYFNVPKGYESLVDGLKQDEVLRRHFFSKVQTTFYAAAGLLQHIWDSLDELAIQTCGHRIAMLTGLGATETASFALCANKDTTRAGAPVPGVELKLVPVGEKLEVRLKRSNVTPGFWRQPELTRAAFDEDGFYRFGDALRFLDPLDKTKGFVFDGRIAEDFKLSTGTWVSVGPLRAKLILHAAPHVRDVVLAGHDRDELTALIFADPKNTPTRDQLQSFLRTFALQSNGSSTRIERTILLDEPASIDAGEITDKGSINQHAVLKRRAALVEQLFTTPPPECVITL